MSAAPSSQVLAALNLLATQPGALWSGLMQRSLPLLTLNPDGSTRQSSPAENVLIEAIMTASSALSDRIGLDTPTDFDHRSAAGGLLMHAPDPSRCLILCHGPSAPLPLLRLALRDVARQLPPPSPPPTPSWQPTPPVWLDADPSLTPSGQSEVYNPFTSA